jgi:hypothetical protein
MVACIACLLVVPEVRRYLGLGKPHHKLRKRRRKLLMSFLIFMLIWIVVGAILWLYFLCPYFNKSGESKSNEPTVVPERPSPTPDTLATPTPTPHQVGPVTIYPPVRVLESEFRLYIFSREYHWKKLHVSVEFAGNDVTNEEMLSYFARIHGDMKSEDALVCVGTASSGIEESEAGEEKRALTRAQQLTTWIRLALEKAEKSPSLYTLNLGHYKERPDDDMQRLVIVFGVKKLEQNVDLDAILSPENCGLLKSKLREKRFPFDLDAYSRCDIRPAS